MGCHVNGPGEAADADYAITGYGHDVCIYSHGRLVLKTDWERAEDDLMEVIKGE